MVNATVTNEPISIQLSAGESMTVPSNEVWKVEVHLAYDDTNGGSDICALWVNGEGVWNAQNSGSGGSPSAGSGSFVFVGDDEIEIKANDSRLGGNISGFVVSE